MNAMSVRATLSLLRLIAVMALVAVGAGAWIGIAMPAIVFAEDRLPRLEAGMNDFRAKPFKAEALLPTLLRSTDSANQE